MNKFLALLALIAISVPSIQAFASDDEEMNSSQCFADAVTASEQAISNETGESLAKVKAKYIRQGNPSFSKKQKVVTFKYDLRLDKTTHGKHVYTVKLGTPDADVCTYTNTQVITLK